MKLTKNQLIKLTRGQLETLGYQEIRDSIGIANGLFVKLISKDIYLTLGFTISSFYDSMFTAAYYLSKTTLWGAVWDDIPEEGYKRVGDFLTKDERFRLLTEEYCLDGVIDSWWDAANKTDINKFIEAVSITEDRFLLQIDLIKKVNASREIGKLFELGNMVLDKVKSNDFTLYEYKYIPKQPIDDIPMIWFQAAEVVLSSSNEAVNINTVKRLAGDAWRRKLLSDLFGNTPESGFPEPNYKEDQGGISILK